MQILVLADTHGKLDEARRVILEHPDASYIIHLGNTFEDAFDLERQTSRAIIPVMGNNDGFSPPVQEKFSSLTATVTG